MLHTLQCQWEDCLKVFKTSEACFNHAKSHIDKQNLSCCWKECDSTSTSKTNLINHLYVHIHVIRGTCYICNRSFKWRGDYQKHQKMHDRKTVKFNRAVALLFE